MSLRRLLLISASALAIMPATAQTVDGGGASEILNGVAEWLGQQKLDEKVIKVLPETDNYRVTLSLNEILKLFPKQGLLKGYFTKFDMLVRPMADGTWSVSSDQIPTAYIDPGGIVGNQKINLHTGDENWTGLFDPDLRMFRTISFDVDYLSIGHDDSNYFGRLRAKSAKGELSVRPVKSGGMDFDLLQTFGSLENLSIKKRQKGVGNSMGQKPDSPESNPRTAVVAKTILRSGSARADVIGKNIRNREIFELLAFFSTHAVENSLKKTDQFEWGSKLKAALPFWDKLSFTGQYSDVVLETPFGNFATKSVFHRVASDGFSNNSQFDYDIWLQGLDYPTPAFSAESLAFLPTDIELAMEVGGIDLETLITKLATDVTWGDGENRPSHDWKSSPRFNISKGVAHINGAELTLTGEVIFAARAAQREAPKFDSTTTWEMSDFDGVLGRLTEASEREPQLNRIAAFARLAKALGKRLPNGGRQWIVSQRQDGSIVVNDRLAVQAAPIEPQPKLMDEGILVYPQMPR